MRCVIASLFLCVVLFASGCSPSLTIVSWEPGAIAPRGARTIVLVDGEGAAGPREMAAKLLVRESKGGWFRVENYPEQVKLTLVQERGEIIGAPIAAIPDNAMWGRVDVIEWDTEDATIEEEDEDGNTIEVPAQRSEVSLQITIVDRAGKVLLREQQYAGEVIVEEGTVHLGDPLTEAARDAVHSFLIDAAPKQVSQIVRLDDSDSGLIPAIKKITDRTWTLRNAERKVRRYLKAHPNNAIATYNIAVLVDAQGRHDEALALYDEAMKINTRDYYIEARAGCARRATAKRALLGDGHRDVGLPSQRSRGSLNDDVKPVGGDAKPVGGDAKPVGEAPPSPQ